MFKVFRVICISGLLISASDVNGQIKGQSVSYNLSELASGKKVTVVNRSISVFSEEKHQGVYISSGPGEGIVWIDSVEFGTGIIELDIKGRDIFQKSFPGLAFHGAADSVYEAVYFRPFNFNTADPVRRIHAVQYVFHPLFTWLKLRTENNGQYEKAVNPAPQADDWFHVKIIVLDARIEVFINGNKEACLSVERLSSIKSGKIGLWTGDGSDGSFANLTITRFSE